jgi:hypothetical protein
MGGLFATEYNLLLIAKGSPAVPHNNIGEERRSTP